MAKIELLKTHEKSQNYTKVVNIDNKARIGVKLDDDKLIDLIYTKFALHKGIAINNYPAFDRFLVENDKEINEILCSAIQRSIMGIVTLTYTNVKSIDKLIKSLNLMDLEVEIYSMIIDEVTDKVFSLLN